MFSNSAGREQFYSDSRGVELVYDLQKSPPLKGVISRSGFHSIGEAVGPRFSSSALSVGQQLSHPLIFVGSYETLWADRDGIYQFDSATGSMETLINMADGGTMFCGTEKQAPKLLLRSEGKLHLSSLSIPRVAKNGFSLTRPSPPKSTASQVVSSQATCTS